MARIVRSAQDRPQAVSSVITVSLPSSVTGDVVAFVIELDTGTLTSVTGNNGGTWTQQNAAANQQWSYVYTCVVGATPDTSIAIGTSSTNTTSTISIIVIKDADTTTLIDVSASSAPAASINQSAPSITTTVSNTLIVHFVGCGGGFVLRPKEGMMQWSAMEMDFRAGTAICSTYQQAAGATGTTQYYHTNNGTIRPVFFVVAFRDAGSGIVEGYVDNSVRAYEYLHIMGDVNYSGHLADNSSYDPSDVSNENISTLSYGSYTSGTVVKHTNISAIADAREFGPYSCGPYRTSSPSGELMLTGFGITETYGSTDNYDLSGEKIFFTLSTNNFNFVASPAIGTCFGLSDKTNARFWRVGTIDTTPAVSAGTYPTVIDIDDSSFVMDEVGTPNTASIGAVMFGSEVAKAQAYIYPGPVCVMRYMTIVGGCTDYPASFATAAQAAKVARINTVLDQGGTASSQFFIAHDIQVGGSEALYWKTTNQSAEWPSAYSEDNQKLNFKIAAAKLEFLIKASSGDTVNMSSTTLNFGNYHKFSIDSATHNSDIYNFAGLNILNATVTLRDISSMDYTGLYLSSCKEVTHNSADLSGGITIDSCVDAQAITYTGATEAALQALVDNIANCEFSNNAVAIRIEFTGTGDIELDFTSITWTGNTTDIHYNSTNSSALTAVMASGSNATTSAISGSATGVTISSPVLSLTVTSSESSSDIKIFNTGTQTIDASTTGTTVSTTTPDTYDWTVQKSGFIPQRGTSVVLGSESVTVNVTLVEDPIYTASHGLTFTTDYSYDASTRVMTIVANQEGRDLYSALIDDFISETSLRNCPFPLFAVGPDRIDFEAVGYYNSATTVGATIDSGDIQFWKGAGMEWEHDTTGNPAKKFYSIKSSNTLQTGSVVGYTQVVTGTASECTLVSDKVNQVIQYYEDTNGDGTPDYEYTGHLLFKGFKTGYYQARWDTVNDGGVTTLESYEYNISLLQTAIAGATGDQSITITTLTDHTSSPLSVGGKSFDYELVDPGTNSGENLLSQLNYDIFTAVDASISGTIYTSYQAFDLPDMIVEAGSTLETEYGHFEGDGAVGDFSGVYLSRSSADHPDIGRFQSNDGSYYTPATVAQLSAPNVTDGRIQICNATGAAAPAWQASTAYSEGDYVLATTGKGSSLGDGVFFVCTTAGTSGGSEPAWDEAADGNTTADNTVVWTVRPTEFDNAVTTTGYATSWTDGEHFAAGDTIRLRWVDEDDLEILTTGIATADSTTTFLNTPEDDTVYDSYGIDGSTVTEYSADFPNVQVDITDPDNVFYIDRFYAWHKYNLTTEDGIRNFFGAVSATNTSNIVINNSVVDIFFDNTKTTSARQGNNIVIQRADGVYPQVTTTSGGGGLGFYYTGIGYSTSSGSGLDTTERNKLLGLYNYDPTTNTVEGSLTYQQAHRIMLAESAGKVAVSGSTVTFRDQADSKDRITATVDANGQRTSVTVDGS